MRKINIAFLMQSGLDIHRDYGPKVHFESVIKQFKKMGYPISLLSLQAGRNIVEYNSETERFISKPLGTSGKKWFVFIEGGIRKIQTLFNLPYLGIFDSYRFCEACEKHLKMCDVFYERYSLMGFGGALAAKRLNKPFILEVHADILNDEMPFHGKKLGKFQHLVAERISHYCLSRACKIVVVSKAVKGRLQNYWKIPEEKIAVVPLGVDVELFEEQLKQLKLVEKEKASEIKTILFVGSFLLWHGVDVLIDSFCYVVAHYPNARLRLVGDGQIKSMIEEKVRQLDLDDYVEFTGDVPHNRIPAILYNADICVAPYNILSVEMWFSPLKVFEYMYMAKPIVATNSGQITEILEDGYSAYLVQAGDSKALADAILKLLNDPETGKRMGENARKRVLEGYTWQEHCKQLEQIILERC